MKTLNFLLLVFILPYSSFAQDQFQFDWTAHTGSPDNDYVYDMDTDDDGNVYFFLDTPWSECHIADTLVNGYGLYITKINPEGTLVWTKYISCTGISGAKTLRATPEGAVYILGVFDDTAHFGTITLVDTSASNVTFLAKLTPEGSFEWAEIVYPSPDFMPYDMEVDPDENVFMTGINPGYFMIIGNDTIFGEKGGWKMALIQYNSSGTPVWGIMTDNNHMARGTDLDIDPQGNIIISGDFMGLKLFYGQDSLVPALTKNFLLASITPGIGFNWLKLSGYDGEMYSQKMLVNDEGEIYVAGFMHGIIYFTTDTISIPGFYEQFGLFKFSTDGEFDWHLASSPGQNYNPRAMGHDISLDEDGNLFISGKFNLVIEIGDFTLVANPPNLYLYNFLIQVNPKGRVLMAETIYGKTYYDDYCERKVSYCGDFLYYSGFFEYSGAIGNEQFTSYGFIDHFLSKIDLLYVAIPETGSATSNINIYSHSGSIFINNLSEETRYVIDVLNLAGQLVYQSEVRGTMESSFSLNQVDGIYLVSVKNAEEMLARKILFRN